MKDVILQIIPILGTIGEIVWAISIVEFWMINYEWSQQFYSKHKMVKSFQLSFMFIGFIYFLYAVLTHQIIN